MISRISTKTPHEVRKLVYRTEQILLFTRNTLLAKPREAGAGWKALFTRIVASNEEIKWFLNIATILMSMVFS